MLSAPTQTGAQTTPSPTPFPIESRCIFRPIGTLCAFGEFEFGSAQTATQRVCCLQTRCREQLDYQAVAPTPTTDRVCAEYRTDCPTTFFLVGSQSATSDRQCQPCQSCAPGTFVRTVCANTDDTDCHPVRQCVSGVQFESAAPTASTDRNCTGATTCSAVLEFQSNDLTPTTDRVCQGLTGCTELVEFQAASPTASSDRVVRFRVPSLIPSMCCRTAISFFVDEDGDGVVFMVV